MKKISKHICSDLRAEYDFSSMKGGVRGKYCQRYKAGTNLALLDKDVAKSFPTDEAVNKALRSVIKAAGMTRPKQILSRAAQRTRD